jgi:hypothetical protein
MTEQRKFGTPKKENSNTLLKPIPITQSSVVKVITLSAVVHKNLSTSGNAVFMIQ